MEKLPVIRNAVYNSCGSAMLLLFVATASAQSLDLSGQSLAHTKNIGRDLRGANLSGADLTMADFSKADLRGANLTAAKLDRVEFDGADLRGVVGWAEADLGLGISANDADFRGTDLRGARIVGGYSGGYFERARFDEADLTEATLAGRFHDATFDGSKVNGALMLGAYGTEPLHDDLRRRGAIVDVAGFAAAVRGGRDFSNAFLRSVRLQEVDLSGANLRGANLHSVSFDHAQLDGANLREAEWYWGTARGARFAEVDLTGAQLDNVRAPGANFDGARLAGTVLFGADLTGASLRDADLRGADLSQANLTGADLTGALLDGVTLDGAILDGINGRDPAESSTMRHDAGRWKYDLLSGVERFITDWSLLLHLMMSPTAAALGVLGVRGKRLRGSFWFLIGVNIAATLPLAARILFGALGGSPTAQMSDLHLWSAWFRLWTLMMPAMGLLFVVAVIAGGVHAVRTVFVKPRPRVMLSLGCVLLTLVNLFAATCVLMMSAPDA